MTLNEFLFFHSFYMIICIMIICISVSVREFCFSYNDVRNILRPRAGVYCVVCAFTFESLGRLILKLNNAPSALYIDAYVYYTHAL